jgi:hypothetical protein
MNEGIWTLPNNYVCEIILSHRLQNPDFTHDRTSRGEGGQRVHGILSQSSSFDSDANVKGHTVTALLRIQSIDNSGV